MPQPHDAVSLACDMGWDTLVAYSLPERPGFLCVGTQGVFGPLQPLQTLPPLIWLGYFNEVPVYEASSKVIKIYL